MATKLPNHQNSQNVFYGKNCFGEIPWFCAFVAKNIS